MYFKPLLSVALGAALAYPAMAVEPNINAGMWETTSTVTLKSAQFSLPARSETRSDCVTPEKIAEGRAFVDNNGDCTFSNRDLRADGMNYSMTCKTAEGGTVAMTADMQFKGETMSGSVDGAMETPMGKMNMTVELSGKRIGACD